MLNDRMKKTATITFHAAHNYGSVLQAHALQQTLFDLGVNNEIINFRTEAQKDQYMPLTKRKGFKYIIKNVYFLLTYSTRKRKYNKFESFIDKYLIKSSREYNTLEELDDTNGMYDYFISGSDQIWNTVPNDANPAYFLPFVENGKRISYAPSFGSGKGDGFISKSLEKYDALSVRDEVGERIIYDMLGKHVPILVDPTLLLSSEYWKELAGDEPLVDEEYLFFYTLFASKSMIQTVKNISKQTGLKVVISNISNQFEIFSGFEKIADTGPKDFLNLIKYAKLTCVTSFHGSAFSILMHKPFFTINTEKDSRISTLLKTVDLMERNVRNCNDEVLKNPYKIDFKSADQAIQVEKEKAIKYLKEALEITE